MNKHQRIINFSAGPATMPDSVLEDAQRELLNYNGSGMSIMEMSHRSNAYDAVHESAINTIKTLLSIPNNYRVLFFAVRRVSPICNVAHELCPTKKC